MVCLVVRRVYQSMVVALCTVALIHTGQLYLSLVTCSAYIVHYSGGISSSHHLLNTVAMSTAYIHTILASLVS